MRWRQAMIIRRVRGERIEIPRTRGGGGLGASGYREEGVAPRQSTSRSGITSVMKLAGSSHPTGSQVAARSGP
jgi:hypothetical protein